MKLRDVIYVLVLALWAPAAQSQEPTAVQPFAGSTILGQTISEFAALPIMLGEDISTVEGRLISTVLKLPDLKSPLEAFRSFEMALSQAGFDITTPGRLERPEVLRLAQMYRDASIGNQQHQTPDGKRMPQASLQRITTFPEYYLVADTTRDDTRTVFVLTVSSEQGLYLMSELTLAVMETGTVTINEEMLTEQLGEIGKAVVYGIEFDTGSATIRPGSEDILQIMANVIAKTPGRFYIVGHTDDTGALELNMGLSSDRAASVTAALTSDYGVPADRVASFGVGPLVPVALNTTPGGKQLNRRVELVQRLE
ncbi:MAG: OmpA family protein [Pseudomonadota bacterium]